MENTSESVLHLSEVEKYILGSAALILLIVGVRLAPIPAWFSAVLLRRPIGQR